MKITKLQLRKRRQNRVRAIVKGSANSPRLAVFRSATNIYAQLIDDTAGKTLVESSSIKLKKEKGIEAAKKVGADIAKKAIAKKITTCVFDRGGNLYHGRVKALADGAREAGLQF